MDLKQILTRLIFIIAGSGFFAAPHNCVAQAVPDTSLNNIIRDDSARQARQAAQAPVVHKNDLIPNSDSNNTMMKKGPFQPNPKKAGLYSALVPGMGQLYNRQYWKVPVVYAGLAIAGYFFIDNLNNYQSYRKAYIGRINNPYPTDQYVGRYDTPQLQQLQSDYSKYLDMTVLFTTVGYALQVIDAITSAHLKNFDVSRDISLKVRPVATPNGIGMGLVMNMK